MQFFTRPVLAGGTLTPPGSPAVGDRYVPGLSATGAWAALAGMLVEWDGTVWRTHSFDGEVGSCVLSLADMRFYVLTKQAGSNYGDLWRPVQAQIDFHGIVESAVADVPSHTGSTIPSGAKWVVKASATGLWAGQDGKIAFWNSIAWLFETSFIARATGNTIAT